MGIQDMELEIKYRPGRKISNADALSRYPMDSPTMQDAFTEIRGMVATLDLNEKVESKDGESTLHD